ncbi:hypothetical protein VHP8226_01387 [Vibrio hippocampi]|uniref:NlpC/P60 domain-containing protein n=2 Tax=Vibrio hippocampi TaxID=654686 RepID=A0ABN8DIL3_9VIBR|nr:hypothetical protein VHP8226_01387 [Vibrio hippocampi]
MHPILPSKRLVVCSLCLTIAALSGCAQSPTSQSTGGDYLAHPDNQRFITQYDKWQGTPYRLGGNSLYGIDCSAFVQTVYQDAYGLALPRTTAYQSKVGTKVAYQEAKSGDLVFFKTGRKTRHVGIYLGSNAFMHASTSKGVIISRLDNPYWASVFWHFRTVN